MSVARAVSTRERLERRPSARSGPKPPTLQPLGRAGRPLPARAGLPQLERYELCEPIGRGGMAEVFRARLQSLGGFARDVAVKVLLPQLAGEPEFIDMLLDEARIAGAIVHPCVVQMLDVGRTGDVFYLVMEYVDGVDLRTLARAVPSGMLPLPMALYIVGEVLRGLHAVHCAVDDQGRPRHIVHRDVSPANVLIDDSGAVKLGDFGIAHASGRLTQTRAGLVKGKSRYMAPEQLAPSAGHPIDRRADLYAVGVTLFEALLGDVARESSYATPYGPMFTWPRVLPPDRLPADVAALLQRAVVDDPRQRFADAATFRRAVVAALHRHAPGYDAEWLAEDLRRLGGAAPDRNDDDDDVRDLEDDDAQTLAESRDVATTLGSRPPLAVVADARVAAVVDRPRTPTPPPTVYGEPASRLYGDDEGGLFAVAERSGGFRALPFASSSALRLSRSSDSRRAFWLVAGASLVIALVATAIGMASSGPPPPQPPPPAPVLAAASPPLALPLPRPASPPLPPAAEGALEVYGPAGARVIIGGTTHLAPCVLPLAAGNYDVRLRWRKQLLVRHVTVEAGRTTAF